MADICRFWLDMGPTEYTGGSRLISKHEGLPYGSEGVYAITEHCGFEHYFFGPRLLDYLRELKKCSNRKARCLSGIRPAWENGLPRWRTASRGSM